MKQKYLLFMFFILNQLFAQADFNYYKMFNINSNTYTNEKLWLKDNTFLVPIVFSTQTYTLDNGTVIQNPNFGLSQSPLKILIARYNDNGEYVSHFTLNSTGYEQLADITIDNSDNIYLTYLVPPGYVLNNESYFVNSATTTSKYMMLKVNTNGQVLWKKTIEGGIISMFSLAISNNEDVFITARANQKNITVDGIVYTNPTPHASQHELTRMIIGKLNTKQPGMAWLNSSTNSTTEVFPSIFVFNNRQPILRTDSQNNVYLVSTLYGSKTTFGQTVFQNNATNREKFFILKYNSNGQLVWGKSPTIPNSSLGISATQFEIDSQNNLIIMDAFRPGINETNQVSYWGQNYTVNRSVSSLIKLNSNGNVLWIKQPQTIQANVNSHMCDIQYFRIVNNKILAFGVFNGHFSYGNNAVINTQNTNKWVSLEFDLNGVVDNYYMLPSSFNLFPINFIGMDSNNRFWFAQKTSFNNGSTNHFIGTFNFTVPVPSNNTQKLVYFRSSGVTLSNENFKNKEFKIYPNPTTDELNIEGEYLENINYQIHDVTGKIITSGELKNNSINVSFFANGVYFLKMFDIDNPNTNKVYKFIKN